LWDLRALRSPFMRAKKPRSVAVHEMRGFLRVNSGKDPRLMLLGVTIGVTKRSTRPGFVCRVVTPSLSCPVAWLEGNGMFGEADWYPEGCCLKALRYSSS